MNTKDNIIEAAIELIRTKGYGWSYEDVSSIVGIRKASIHYHFPTKDELIFSVTKTYIGGVKKIIEGIFTDTSTSEDKLWVIANCYKSIFFSSDHKLCLCLKLSQDLSSLSAETKEELQEFHSYIQEVLQRIVKEGISTGEFSGEIDPAIFANLFFSTCQGMHILGCYYLNEQEFVKSINFLVSILN